MTRPVPTAAATGRVRVATKVTVIAILAVGWVRHTVATSPSRSELTPTTIRTAAKVGVATWETDGRRAPRG